MKRLIIGLILIPLILLLFWFKTVQKTNLSYPNTITIYYTSENQRYEPLLITNEDQIKTITDHINKLRYVYDTNAIHVQCENNYIINLKYDNGIVYIIINEENGRFYMNGSNRIIIGNVNFFDNLNYKETTE